MDLISPGYLPFLLTLVAITLTYWYLSWYLSKVPRSNARSVGLHKVAPAGEGPDNTTIEYLFTPAARNRLV